VISARAINGPETDPVTKPGPASAVSTPADASFGTAAESRGITAFETGSCVASDTVATGLFAPAR
jgi:hypothetical protein